MPPNVGQPQYMPPQQPLLQYQQPQQQYQQQYLPPSSSQQLYLNLAQYLQPLHQYFHPLGGQQQQYPQQQWYPQQQRYPQQQQFDQLHQQYQQPPLPSQQCPTPAIYTSTSHTQYPRHALSADISLAPTYLSADATALRTIDETVPMSPEAAAVTQPEGAADILESDLYSILEKYMRNTSELKPGSPAFERRIDAAVA